MHCGKCAVKTLEPLKDAVLNPFSESSANFLRPVTMPRYPSCVALLKIFGVIERVSFRDKNAFIFLFGLHLVATGAKMRTQYRFRTRKSSARVRGCTIVRGRLLRSFQDACRPARHPATQGGIINVA